MAKEKPKTTAKIRQKKLAVKIMENNGISVSKAMKEVGYSDNYSKNPQTVTATKSWQQLMDEYLPDSLIAEKHNALLNKKRVVTTISGDTYETDEIDTNAVKAGVELGYKVKGRFAPEKIEHSIREVKIIRYE